MYYFFILKDSAVYTVNYIWDSQNMTKLINNCKILFTIYIHI